MVTPDSTQHRVRQPVRFGAKQECIAGAVFDIAVCTPAAGLYGKKPRVGEPAQTSIEIVMNFDFRKIVIVQAGPLQTFVIQAKSQRLDQMQSGAGVGAQPNDIAGIRRDFRLE